jgi:tryptophan-rich sensory protein
MTPYLVAGGIAVVVALCGALATDIGPWYRNLRKPTWQPPDWLFGPAWTSIFTLIAIGAGLAWNRAEPGERLPLVVLPFAVNLVLNVAWSFLFFRLRRPRLAFLEVLALWASIVWLLASLWQVSPAAGALVVPYLLWVTFASVLNRTIIRLNPEVG